MVCDGDVENDGGAGGGWTEGDGDGTLGGTEFVPKTARLGGNGGGVCGWGGFWAL